jgi:hypothetical protein
MPLAQKIFALLVCAGVFTVTVAMVRRRQLREEYSVLWLATSLVMFVLVLRYEWLVALTNLIGAAVPTTTLFLGAILFLMLIVMQFSIKLSELADKVKNLAQENALLRAELQGRGSESGGPANGSDRNS